MKHIIVGTAGHIDHGKSALVKASPAPIPTAWKKSSDARVFARKAAAATQLGYAQIPESLDARGL